MASYLTVLLLGIFRGLYLVSLQQHWLNLLVKWWNAVFLLLFLIPLLASRWKLEAPSIFQCSRWVRHVLRTWLMNKSHLGRFDTGGVWTSSVKLLECQTRGLGSFIFFFQWQSVAQVDFKPGKSWRFPRETKCLRCIARFSPVYKCLSKRMYVYVCVCVLVRACADAYMRICVCFICEQGGQCIIVQYIFCSSVDIKGAEWKD